MKPKPLRDIPPLTGKQKRRTPRPRFLVFRKSIKFVQGVMAFVCFVACLMVTGCHTNSSGWPVIWFMNNGHSQRADAPSISTGLPYAADPLDEEHLLLMTPRPDSRFQIPAPVELQMPHATVMPRAALAFVDPADDCGACNTNSSITNPPTMEVRYLKFTAPVEYDGFNLYGGTNTDRSDWRLLLSTNATSIPILLEHGFYFYGVRAFLRNGINGTKTESAWATR